MTSSQNIVVMSFMKPMQKLFVGKFISSYYYSAT